ncbi:universal stress protein [Paraliomyxa miuraensis]|uniref:universal stress protein n=1 Tax=Paraliomyxa miuraensis TaxID=376150 RepID=UPI002257DE38|nr:universal stress protein [Paraliomyxa miuraensis]MCX4239902.1 universal stress protein [Paraliomyxa miuraensis]
MTNVDQFESVFRSADKPVFHLAPVDASTVVVVSDRTGESAQAFADAVRRLLHGVPSVQQVQVLPGEDWRTTGELLEAVQKAGASLVCTHRNLCSDGWRWPHSLGEHLDVLTQVSHAPVLVCPHPELVAPERFAERGTDRVMAVTDHLAGDDRLVSWALALTERGGRLLLSHVEDERSFDRMIEVIAKIPALDTDTARRTIRAQLLKEPHDYIRSCREGIERIGSHVTVEEIVTMGHRLADHVRLVKEHDVDVLVLNTRDDDQLAMHGLAYPLAVELREIPLLLL